MHIHVKTYQQAKDVLNSIDAYNYDYVFVLGSGHNGKSNLLKNDFINTSQWHIALCNTNGLPQRHTIYKVESIDSVNTNPKDRYCIIDMNKLQF